MPDPDQWGALMSLPVTLADLVRVKQRFARSANVERDSGSEAISGYLPTARAVDVVGRVATAMLEPSAGRAISVTGPYGSGKSSLALFLEGLLAPANDKTRRVAHAVLSVPSA